MIPPYHVLEIKDLAAAFPNYAGLAYDTNDQLKIAFRSNDRKEVILLDADQARHVALVLASLGSPSPGSMHGDGSAIGLHNKVDIMQRDLPLDVAMDQYMRGFNQIAHAEEALDKGFLTFKVKPTLGKIEPAKLPTALNGGLPEELRLATFATFFPKNSRADELFRPLETRQSYDFVVFGQKALKLNMLTGQSLSPTYDKHLPRTGEVVLFTGRPTQPQRNDNWVSDQQVAGSTPSPASAQPR